MEAAQLKHRLTAILMADVVGYSRLMVADESGTHTRFGAYLKEVIEPAIAEHGGRPVRSMGDGLLVEFDSAIAAVRSAVTIQRELAGCEDGVAETERIRLRMGINTGDVIVDDRDIYGNSVNIAARLESLAGPGEIFATQSVCDQLRGVPGLSFEDRGEFHLKNIDYPVRVFRVDERQPRGAIAVPGRLLGAWRQTRRLLTSRPHRTIPLILALLVITASIAGVSSWRDYTAFLPRSSIVVLPFRNLSDDPSQDYFADAVTDDLTTDLSRIPGAFVIARATAFTYKNRSVDVRQVGREVGVRYLLEGSIRKIGSKVQVNVQFIDTASGAQIWADRFENDVKDLWELEGAVAGRIATSLDIQLVRAESRRAARESQSADADAGDLRLRAMGLYISGITPENTLAARKLLAQSVQLDPRFAEAWAWLADLLLSDYLHGWNDIRRDQLGEAEKAARQALAIDQNLPLAHFVQGFLQRTKGDHQAALEAFTQAIKLNPNFARAYAQQANELISVGRPEEAPPLVQKAIKLSPHDPSLGTFYWILGRGHFYAGSYSEAIPWFRKSVELRPNDWYNRLFLVSAYSITGQTAEAKKNLEEFDRIPRFAGYTVARTAKQMQVNPNDNALIVAGRQKLAEGLLAAGMAAQ
jgi:adenylate cyclase